MLDINEYNKLLYKQLDKEVKRKEMMTDYGRYLQHSKNTGSESNVELQAASWLANFRGLTTSNGFLKTPQGMKEICEGLIPQASKLLRKANKKGAPEETKAELRNARKFLEDCLADANAALQHSDEDPNYLTHGEKWRKHKYIAIENGRYIYPEDLKKSSSLQNIGAAIGANKKSAVKPAGPQGPVATGTVKQNARGIGVKEYVNSQVVKLHGKDEAEKKEGPIKKRRRDEETSVQESKEEAANKQWEKGFEDSITEYANKAIRGAKDRINAATDPDDPWLQKQANNSGTEREIRESAQKKIEELRQAKIGVEKGETKGERTVDPNNTQGHQVTTESGRKNQLISARVFDGIAATELAKKKKRNDVRVVRHSDSSDSITATALSKEEYEDLLKKAESLT